MFKRKMVKRVREEKEQYGDSEEEEEQRVKSPPKKRKVEVAARKGGEEQNRKGKREPKQKHREVEKPREHHGSQHVPVKKGGVIAPLQAGADTDEEEDSDNPGDEDPTEEDPFSRRSATVGVGVKKHGEELVHCLATDDRMFVKRWVSLKSPAA
jgi:hypothetical protein